MEEEKQPTQPHDAGRFGDSNTGNIAGSGHDHKGTRTVKDGEDSHGLQTTNLKNLG